MTLPRHRCTKLAYGHGAVLAAVLLGCGGGGHSATPGSPASHAGAPLRLSPCNVAPQARCGTLRVALAPAHPGGRQLGLRVAAVGDPGKPVLLALAGGPGQPGTPFLGRTRSRLGAVADRFRLVVIDQRGTGAGALRCPALQRAMGTSDLTVAPAPAVRDCARRLGPSRALYTTTQVVADLEALRRALQAARMWIMGASYGTYVAERYALAHPRNVAGLVLASVVPQTGVDATLQDNLRAAGRVLRAACERCSTDPARDLHRAAAGDRSGLDRLVAATRRAQAAPASVLSQGLHAATLCAELAPRRTARRVWPFDAATAAHNGINQLCRNWPPTEPPAGLDRRLPAVPTLLLEGAADLSTNVAWMRQEARWIPHPTIRVLNGVGHGVLRSPAGIRALRSFLESGSGP